MNKAMARFDVLAPDQVRGDDTEFLRDRLRGNDQNFGVTDINHEIQACMENIRHLSVVLDVKQDRLLELLERRQSVVRSRDQVVG